jgi:uncharacterized membrane protein YeaQ/YmgE (transglycosylase-associated protein family)
MNKLLTCRRTFLAFTGILALLVLALVHNEQVSAHIVTIILGIAGANAAQGVLSGTNTGNTGKQDPK